MENYAKVVIVGGGVVGCSILYHLSKFGLKDCILLERKELTSGSSWHAAGNVHVISNDPNISSLMAYTINLYKDIEKESGHSTGFKSSGGFYLASNEIWDDYLKRERSKARYMGLEQEFVSLDEIAKKNPLIDPKRYISALWDPIDGEVDPSGVTYAFAKAAKKNGGKYYTHTLVKETISNKDGSWNVITDKGNIKAEIVINAGGLWAREVGLLAGINLPVQPMEHHYLITESIPEIEAMGDNKRLPVGTDFEGNIYFRQEGKGLLLGTYERKSTPWKITGTPLDFGHELLEPKLENIQDRLAIGFERMPALQKAGIKNIVNGPFTFGPDGSPLIGPVPGLKNYWVAVGVMAGFCQGGGVGKCIAEWIIDGEPSIDVWAMDVARFGEYASPHYGTIKSSENYERRFIMTFPNESLPKGRKQKTTSLYDYFINMGAVMGDNFGLEHVLWFSENKNDAFEEPTFKRNKSFKYIEKEVKNVRSNIGYIELANFSKHYFTGPDAYKFLNFVMAGKIPKPGKLNLSPMLSPKGKLNGDLTIGCLDNNNYYVFGSGASQEFHRRWFELNLDNYNLRYENRSEKLNGISIAGPKSRIVLQKIVREDVSNENFKFRDIKKIFVGGVPALVCRLSFTGELGYEIYVEPQYLIKLHEEILDAGKEFNIKPFGARALMSMRLEKSWGAWTLDFRPDFTPQETGLDKFIDWEKKFIGKEHIIDKKINSHLCVLEIIGSNVDVTGNEAILNNKNAIGYVTSGGFAHYTNKSIAFAYIFKDKNLNDIEVEINGEFYKAKIINKPLYDPQGLRMKL